MDFDLLGRLLTKNEQNFIELDDGQKQQIQVLGVIKDREKIFEMYNYFYSQNAMDIASVIFKNIL